MNYNEGYSDAIKDITICINKSVSKHGGKTMTDVVKIFDEVMTWLSIKLHQITEDEFVEEINITFEEKKVETPPILYLIINNTKQGGN